MPIRTRQKSGPSSASIERNPLWPAVPPPHFTRSLPGRKSISSWITVISAGEIAVAILGQVTSTLRADRLKEREAA